MKVLTKFLIISIYISYAACGKNNELNKIEKLIKKSNKKLDKLEDEVICLINQDCRGDDGNIEFTVENVNSFWECENLIPSVPWFSFGFTYNSNSKKCYILRSLEKCKPKDGFISGKKDCIDPSLSSRSSCPFPAAPCGSCPCCIGVCTPFVNHCLGHCQRSFARSVAGAEFSAIAKASINDCSSECENAGSDDSALANCNNCVISSIPGSDNSPGVECLGCVAKVLTAFYECLNEFGAGNIPELIVCVIEKLRATNDDNCVKCVCSIISRISPALGEVCYDLADSGATNRQGNPVHGGSGHSSCASGYENYNKNGENLCVKLFTTTANFENARLRCGSETNQASLAVVQSNEKAEFLARMISISQSSCSTADFTNCAWIAVQAQNLAQKPPNYKTQSGWVSLNGLDNPQQNVFFWLRAGTPQQVFKADYVAMNFVSPESWINLESSEEILFFCEYNL